MASREILLLGDPVPAARMHALGVISRLAAPENLEAEVGLIIDSYGLITVVLHKASAAAEFGLKAGSTFDKVAACGTAGECPKS